ncbi:MAG: YceD family protein [bacterium]
MKILIDDIPEKGVDLRITDTIKGLDSNGENIILKEPVTLKANVKRVGSKILVKGVIKTLVQLECGRCLEDFLYHVDEDFTATFLPAEQRPKEPDLELDSEDLDVSFYEGKIIDLSELVREEILLAIPMNPLCRVNCRGVCPECGKNLNEGKCYCSGSDFRWSKSRKSEDDYK